MSYKFTIDSLNPFNSILDEKLCLETIDDLEKAAQKMKANGFNFFYHHKPNVFNSWQT